MRISTKLDRLYAQARGNRWLYLFAIFNRVALAAGFLPSGMTKILGERFTVLSVNHPMGNYLEALYHTGYYYTMIGVLQVAAALLLLIPRTALLGALLYFPIIFNICILSLSVRFEGSFVTSLLMVLANLYLLCWYYPTWKLILPIKHETAPAALPRWKELNTKFPAMFFAGVGVAVALVMVWFFYGYELMPYNSLKQCQTQCPETDYPAACFNFCDCIHQNGQSLAKCLEAYELSKE